MKINGWLTLGMFAVLWCPAAPVLSAETAPKLIPITTVDIIKRVSTSSKDDSERLTSDIRSRLSKSRGKFKLGDGAIAEMTVTSDGSERISIYPPSPGVPPEVSFWAAGVPGIDTAAGEFPWAEMKLVPLDESERPFPESEAGRFYRIEVSLRTAKWNNSSFRSLWESDNVRLKSEGLNEVLNGLGVLSSEDLKKVLIKNSGSSKDWDPELGWSAVQTLPRGIGEITILNFHGTKGCARLDHFLEQHPDFQYVGNSSGFKWISKDQTKSIRADPNRPGCIGQAFGGRHLQRN